MGVDGIRSGASDPVLDAAAAGATAATGPAVAMLANALDTESQMMAELMKAMQSANPPGVGGTINTWA